MGISKLANPLTNIVDAYMPSFPPPLVISLFSQKAYFEAYKES
jgi:hypothetical protein